MGGVLTLYDAPRCPYCARVRILLAEKAIAYDTVDYPGRPEGPSLMERVGGS